MRTGSICATIALCAFIAGCGGSGESGQSLSGAYSPQFPPGASRFDRMGADLGWEFSADGTVVTRSQHRTVRWSYKTRGKEIRLTGIDEHNRGERRTFTRTDNNCIWDGHGKSSVDVKFCPTQ